MSNIASYGSINSDEIQPPSIMVTVGPTFETADLFRRGIESGARWFRLPMGYRDRSHLKHAQIIVSTRRDADEASLLLDLPSSRPRIGNIDDLEPLVGKRIVFYDPNDKYDDAGDAVDAAIPMPDLRQLCQKIKVGQRMWFLDGRIELVVDSVAGTTVRSRWLRGPHKLKANNSLFLPDTESPYTMVTQEDRKILSAFNDAGLVPEWIALSLVSSVVDVQTAREELDAIFSRPVQLMAKIETASAVREHEAILDESDGIMVARGDLGQALTVTELPNVQDELVSAARVRGKPVVVATQFLEVFAETGVPQRSELSDLALAAIQKTSAIMLGKETVWSQRPIETIALARDVLLARTDRSRRLAQALPCSMYRNRKGDRPFTVAIEGPNGVGKSTLCDLLVEQLGLVYRRGVPEEWEDHRFKLRMIRDADWLASAFYFFSGAIEVDRELAGEVAPIVMDRSLWSTLAVHAAHDPARLNKLLAVLDSMVGHISFPDLTLVLEAEPHTCKSRIANKTGEEKEYDAVAPDDDAFETRERRFYRWLATQGPLVRFIQVDSLLPAQVAQAAVAYIEESGICSP